MSCPTAFSPVFVARALNRHAHDGGVIENVRGKVVEVCRGDEGLDVFLDEGREGVAMFLVEFGHDIVEKKDGFSSHKLVDKLDTSEFHHENDCALLPLGSKKAGVSLVDEEGHLVLVGTYERYPTTKLRLRQGLRLFEELSLELLEGEGR